MALCHVAQYFFQVELSSFIQGILGKRMEIKFNIRYGLNILDVYVNILRAVLEWVSSQSEK